MIKNLKKIISLCLAVSITSTAFGNVAMAASDEKTNMDELDVILASHNVMHSENGEENLWPETISNLEMIPLHNSAGDIVAYYLSFPDQYAVINNNLENPAAIEFGEGDNDIIREILDNNTASHIVYNNPFEIYDSNNSMIARSSYEEELDLYEYFPDLEEENTTLAEEHLQKRAAIENLMESMPVPYNSGDYGFLTPSMLPSGTYTSDNIPNVNNTSWMVVTSDFSDIANNHCAATAVTNLALYYAAQGYSSLNMGSDFSSKSKRATFEAVHKLVGNGPKATIEREILTYFRGKGCEIKCASASSYRTVKDAVSDGHPCTLLLENSLLDWHWILSVGYREYSSGEKYIRIMDGWNRNTNRYYRPNIGSNWMFAEEFWM